MPSSEASQTGRMRHGIVILPELRWSEAAARWRDAERLGFDHAWTFDHLMWRWFRDRTWFAALPTLTAAAGVTSHIGLGTLVTNPNFRHPVTLAKEVMTLDDISDGRFLCGIGAGADGFDARVLGRTAASAGGRTARFEEFVELLDQLLTHPETTYRGSSYEAYGAAMHPGCVQQPRVPFAIAASGRRGMLLAARFAQTWVTLGQPGDFRPQRFDQSRSLLADQVLRMEDACAAVGRDPASLGRLVVTGSQIGGVLDSPESFAEAEGTFTELGFTDMVVFWPRPESPFAADPEVLEKIAPRLSRSTE